MIFCEHCGFEGVLHDTFQPDAVERGFWCEMCDGYTYFEEREDQHKFTLITEQKCTHTALTGHNSKKLAKRLSPFRYPGGKSKLVDFLSSHLQEKRTKTLISPYTGGGSFELAMLEAGVVESVHLNDLDLGIYAVWWVIKHMPYALIDRIENSNLTHADYFTLQDHINRNYSGLDLVEAAWSALVVNRLAYSGIAKANPLGGRHGSQEQLLSRWNPTELIRKITYIHQMSDAIIITQRNAIEVIEEAYWTENATIFIDPPYVKKGKDLYPCYYTKRDHIELAVTLESLHRGCPGADIVLTYDNDEWLKQLYESAQVKQIDRYYSA